MNQETRLRFSPGEIVATRGADALLREQNLHPVKLLARHLTGDWGEVGAEDAQAEEALEARLLLNDNGILRVRAGGFHRGDGEREGQSDGGDTKNAVKHVAPSESGEERRRPGSVEECAAAG